MKKRKLSALQVADIKMDILLRKAYSRDAVNNISPLEKIHGRDAWIGEGGNPRTSQKSEFDQATSVSRTRDTLDHHERDQLRRDRITYAPDGDADRLDPLQQLGRIINITQFQRHLILLNPNLIFEVSLKDPTKVGIYIVRLGHKVLVSAMEAPTPVNAGMMPEFSIMSPRMEDRPTADGRLVNQMSHAYEKVRGWRTVLAKLYIAHLITESQISSTFKPQFGRSSELWQRQVTPTINIGE